MFARCALPAVNVPYETWLIYIVEGHVDLNRLHKSQGTCSFRLFNGRNEWQERINSAKTAHLLSAKNDNCLLSIYFP